MSKDFILGFEVALGALTAFNLMTIASGIASLLFDAARSALGAPGRWLRRRRARKQRAIDAAKHDAEAQKLGFRSGHWLNVYTERIKYGGGDLSPEAIVGADNFTRPSGQEPAAEGSNGSEGASHDTK